MPIAFWKRTHNSPSGALPRRFFSTGALLLLCPFIAAILLFDFFSADEPAAALQDTPMANQEPANQQSLDTARKTVAGEADRVRAQRARDQLLQQQEQLAAADRRPQPPTASSMATSGDSPLTDEEWKLQQALRLEAIERRQRSLRSDPLVKSARTNNPTSPPPGVITAPAQESPTQESAPGPSPSDHLDNIKATLALFTQADNAQLQPENEIQSPAPGRPSPTQSPPPGDRPDYRNPPTISIPDDPPGWERIYEGSFLEAVLVTQIAGDYPGPVLAQVSVPFYSRDRQQTLIPPGTRLIGTAQQVTNRDQSRLGVAFHRLIFPNGHWITLPFLGLNQLGETGLKDRVNRHYLSLFAATGAIGILSGLTLQGSDPYRGGLSGFRSGAGQGFAQGASRIMERFLNRLPTITIRAGHRLRVWFTSDILLPTDRSRTLAAHRNP